MSLELRTIDFSYYESGTMTFGRRAENNSQSFGLNAQFIQLAIGAICRASTQHTQI